MARPDPHHHTSTPQLRSVLALAPTGSTSGFGRVWATAAEVWSDAVVVHVTFGHDQSADPDRFPVFYARDDDGVDHPVFCAASAGDGRRWHETVTIEVDPARIRHLDVHLAWAGRSAPPGSADEVLCRLPLRRGLQLVRDG